LPELVQDVVIAVVVTALALGLPALDHVAGAESPGRFGGVAALLTVASSAPLVLRRRFPFGSTLLCGAVTLGALGLGQPAPLWAVMVAAFSAAYHLDRHRVLLGVGALLWQWAVVLLIGGDVLPSDVPTAAAFALMPVSLGYALRLHADRAEQLRRLHVAEKQRARARERTRIARDVHDIVGHHLSAIRLRAVGSRKAGVDAAEALGTVAELSEQALGEVRRMVGLLREGAEDPLARSTGDAGDTLPRLADLDRLAGRFQGSTRVDVLVELDEVEPPDILQHCLYRVAQEALTNVARHAAGGMARLRVTAGRSRLVLTVEDDGPGGPVVVEGNGLRGMRERVELLGGTFSAGPHRARGWQVRAELPMSGGNMVW
jgi:signal transduction histidine kinase